MLIQISFFGADPISYVGVKFDPDVLRRYILVQLGSQFMAGSDTTEIIHFVNSLAIEREEFTSLYSEEEPYATNRSQLATKSTAILDFVRRNPSRIDSRVQVDLVTLKPRGWISDWVIGTVAVYLRKVSSTDPGARSGFKNGYVADPFFLFTVCFKSTFKTKKPLYSKIRNSNVWLIPYNLGGTHWLLIAVSFDSARPSILVYDSLGEFKPDPTTENGRGSCIARKLYMAVDHFKGPIATVECIYIYIYI